MGFGKKKDSQTGKMINLDEAYLKIIKPSIEEADCSCVRADELSDSGMIDVSMYALLYKADIVIADITTLNPNAIYELGARHVLKPSSTIIFCDTSTPQAFDINHLRRFNYTKYGEELSEKEIKDGRKNLGMALRTALNSNNTDSPLYTYFPKCQAPVIDEEDIERVIGSLRQNEQNIFALTTKALNLEHDSNYSEAVKLWHRLAERSNNDLYYLQREALCTYKQDESSIKHLMDARDILNKIPSPSDYETLGLLGAIYKRLYYIDKNLSTLDMAIETYKKGWTLFQHYYPGENYANCIDLKYYVTEHNDEKIWCKMESKHTRRSIISLIENQLADGTDEDLMWQYATLANCYHAFSDLVNEHKYEQLFISREPSESEFATYKRTKSELLIY